MNLGRGNPGRMQIVSEHHDWIWSTEGSVCDYDHKGMHGLANLYGAYLK